MQPSRVLVVDGSAADRATTAQTLRTDPAVDVVGTASSGPLAFAMTASLRPDVVTLDGDLEAGDLADTVASLRRAHPPVVVVLLASPTPAGHRTAANALDAGIADFLTKPPAPRTQVAVQMMVLAHLLPRVKALTGHSPPVPRSRRPQPSPVVPPGRPDRPDRSDRSDRSDRPDRSDRSDRPGRPAGPDRPARPAPVSPALAEVLATSGVQLGAPAGVRRPRPSTQPVSLLLLGASTGGPEALAEVVRRLDPRLTTPVLVVQHMPVGFTTLLAERLDRVSHLECREAVDGDRVRPGQLLVAPGGRHLEVHREGNRLFVRTTDDPPEHFVRPAVDVLFRTAAAACRDGVLAVVLTGMGRDGTAGALAVLDAGGSVIAQDEATSVVWGMPGSVVRADLADAVLPLPAIGAGISARVLRPSPPAARMEP